MTAASLRKHTSVLVALGVLIAIVTSSAWGAPGTSPRDEDLHYETVVTSSRTTERAFEAPRSITAIGTNELDEQGSGQTPETLDNVVGVTIQRTNSAGGAAIIRGLLGQHVLLLIDGVRLNTAITRYGPNQLLNTVDPFTLRRVEVLRGPGSVLYGSDALGGVIHLMTRRPSFDPWRAWDAEMRVLGHFDSAASAWITHAAASGHLRQVGLRVGGTFRRFGDLSGGDGTQRFTAYWEGDVDVSARWHLNDTTRISLGYSTARQHDAPRTDRASHRDFRIFRDQLRDLASAELHHHRQKGWLRQLRATLSFHSQRELRERFRLDSDRQTDESDTVAALGLSVHAESQLPANRLLYGMDVYHDLVGSQAVERKLSTGEKSATTRGRYVDDSRYTQFGIFAVDQLSLLGDKLRLDGGARFSLWLADIPDDPATSTKGVNTQEVSVVGSLHGRYLFGDGLSLLAGISQGFRAPNIDDYSALGCSGQGYDIPNPQLKAEKSITAEMGMKLDLFGALRGSLSYFFTYIDDLIIRRKVEGAPTRVCDAGDPMDVTRRENAQTGRIHGVEAELALRLGHIQLFSWVAWTHGVAELDGEKEPLSRIPPLNGQLGVRYRHDKRLPFFVELGLRWATRQGRISERDANDRRICPDGAAGCEGTPAYAALTLRAGARLWGRVHLTATLRNLMNSTYRVHGSGLDAPGLSALVGLELRHPAK